MIGDKGGPVISGAHVIVYSSDAEADRAFLRDILRFTHVDVGGGWLIFGLPPSEIAVHPTDGSGSHELYLMCDDIEQFCAEMERHGIAASPPSNQGWGVLTHLALPGGGKLGVYQPRHERPAAATSSAAPAKAASRSKPAARKPRGKPARAAASKPTRAASKPARAASKPATRKPAVRPTTKNRRARGA